MRVCCPWPNSTERADVYDASLAGAKRRHTGLGHKENRSDIDGKHVVPCFYCDLVHLAGVVRACIVHEQVEISQIGNCLLGSRWNCIGIAEVAAYGGGLDPKRLNFCAGLGGVFP